MKIATIIARVLLGLVFFVFGLNKFLNFIHMPPPSGQAGAFFGALYATHYLYVIATCEVIGGLLLLLGRYVPLGLALLKDDITARALKAASLNRELVLKALTAIGERSL